MDRWTDRQTCRRTDKNVGRWMDRQTYSARRTDTQTNMQEGKRMDRQTCRQADEQTDKHAGRQTDRLTNKHAARWADRQARRQAERKAKRKTKLTLKNLKSKLVFAYNKIREWSLFMVGRGRVILRGCYEILKASEIGVNLFPVQLKEGS